MVNALRFFLFHFLFLLSYFASAETLVGEAKYKGQLEYTEFHEITYFKNMIQKIDSNYLNLDKKIAFRQIEFPENHYIPNLVFKDELSTDTYSVTVNGLKAVLKTFIGGKEKTTNFDVEDHMVLPDSISKYIYDNFSLVMSEPKVLKCLFPSSHRFLDIIVKNEGSKVKDEVVFSIKPKSSIISLFTTKTFIHYNMQTKAWKKYIGPSNLKNSKGKNLQVEIEYQ